MKLLEVQGLVVYTPPPYGSFPCTIVISIVGIAPFIFPLVFLAPQLSYGPTIWEYFEGDCGQPIGP